VATSTALLCAGTLVVGQAAQAAFVDVPQSGTPGRLVLAADPYPFVADDLSPGDSRVWKVDARTEASEPASLTLEVRTGGDLARHPSGTRVRVERCDVAWTDAATPECAEGPVLVTELGPATAVAAMDTTFTLRALGPGVVEHLLVTVSLPDAPGSRGDDSLMGLTGDLGLVFTAASTQVDVVAPVEDAGELPATGSTIGLVPGLLALAAGAAGLLIVTRRTRDERGHA
jgi:hypothetical protein